MSMSLMGVTRMTLVRRSCEIMSAELPQRCSMYDCVGAQSQE